MKMNKPALLGGLVLLALTIGGSLAQVPPPGSGRDAANVIPMRERARIMEGFWAWKKAHVLPQIMREFGVDMWIVRND